MSKNAIKRVNKIEEEPHWPPNEALDKDFARKVEESENSQESEENSESEEVEESESGNEADEESDSAEESEAPVPTKSRQIQKAPATQKENKIMLNKFPTQILVCGPTEAGKTNAVKHIVRSIAHKFQYIIVYCPTAKLNKDYDFLPNKYICDYSKGHLEGIIAKQNEYKAKGKDYHCLIIFDDIVGTIKTHNNSIFDQLATSSRHSNISLIYITQQVTKISTTIRNNVQTVLATRINKLEADTIYERCKCIATKKEFFDIISEKVNLVMYQFICLQNSDYTLVKFPKTQDFKLKYKY